jgi:MoaA/NifB/PqqE/SkfB family radical SAM enzyme
VGALGLRLVEISITDRCQCRCNHCFAATKNLTSTADELSKVEIISLLDDIKRMGGTEVCFSGGEPLLRNDIMQLVNYAHQIGLVARLITNGILLTDGIVKDLKQAGLSWCSISIDSPKPEIHDEFRCYPGCFEKAITGLRSLVKHKVPCNIITVARKDLIHSGGLEEIVTLGQNIGVTMVRINFPLPLGRFKDRQEQVLSLEEREQVRKLLSCGIVSMAFPRERTKCTAAVTKINILANGDVTPCVFVPRSYGNLRQHTLNEIWLAMEEHIQKYESKGQCPMCDLYLRKKLFDEIGHKARGSQSPGGCLPS